MNGNLEANLGCEINEQIFRRSEGNATQSGFCIDSRFCQEDALGHTKVSRTQGTYCVKIAGTISNQSDHLLTLCSLCRPLVSAGVIEAIHYPNLQRSRSLLEGQEFIDLQPLYTQALLFTNREPFATHLDLLD